MRHLASSHPGAAAGLAGAATGGGVSAAAAAAAAVDELLGGGVVGGVGGSGVSLFNCAVCSKLFTKETYLLRHMEMKLDDAHAAELEHIRKTR